MSKPALTTADFQRLGKTRVATDCNGWRAVLGHSWDSTLRAWPWLAAVLPLITELWATPPQGSLLHVLAGSSRQETPPKTVSQDPPPHTHTHQALFALNGNKTTKGTQQTATHSPTPTPNMVPNPSLCQEGTSIQLPQAELAGHTCCLDLESEPKISKTHMAGAGEW